jgi:hypothetical protein
MTGDERHFFKPLFFEENKTRFNGISKIVIRDPRLQTLKFY